MANPALAARRERQPCHPNTKAVQKKMLAKTIRAAKAKRLIQETRPAVQAIQHPGRTIDKEKREKAMTFAPGAANDRLRHQPSAECKVKLVFSSCSFLRYQLSTASKTETKGFNCTKQSDSNATRINSRKELYKICLATILFQIQARPSFQGYILLEAKNKKP